MNQVTKKKTKLNVHIFVLCNDHFKFKDFINKYFFDANHPQNKKIYSSKNPTRKFKNSIRLIDQKRAIRITDFIIMTDFKSAIKIIFGSNIRYMNVLFITEKTKYYK